MSTSTARSFLAAVTSSAELERQIDALGARASLEALARLATAYGYKCAPADFEPLLSDESSSEDELDDEALAAVAGGVAGATSPILTAPLGGALNPARSGANILPPTRLTLGGLRFKL